MPPLVDERHGPVFEIKPCQIVKKVMNRVRRCIGSYIPVLGLATEQSIPEGPSHNICLMPMLDEPPCKRENEIGYGLTLYCWRYIMLHD